MECRRGWRSVWYLTHLQQIILLNNPSFKKIFTKTPDPPLKLNLWALKVKNPYLTSLPGLRLKMGNYIRNFVLGVELSRHILVSFLR